MEALESLVVSAQEGDKEAFEEIILRFQDMAYAVAYGMLGDPDIAEDVAQEAFLDAYQNLSKLRFPAAFPGWFRRVVIKHSDRQIRGKRPLSLAIDQAITLPSKAPGPEAIVEKNQIREAVQRAITALPKNQRLATTLYYIQGYSQNEIAEILEVPVTTIKKRLFTSKERIKRRMILMVQEELQANKPSQDEHFVNKVRFFIALKANDFEQVKALVKENPDLLHVKTEWGVASEGYYWPLGITALHWAAGTGNNELAAFLHAQGAKLNGEAGQRTPLHIAALMGQEEMVQMLVERGANVNSQTEKGHTPLHYAVMRNYPEVAEVLLENGAKVDVADKAGRTAMAWAEIKGQSEMIDLLIEYGATKPDKETETASPVVKTSPDRRRVPVGEAVLGRVLNAEGKPVDGFPDVDMALQKPIYLPASLTINPVLETRIKVIDLLAPFKRGGQNGIFTPLSGVGKFVVLNQIVANLITHYDGYVVCIGLEDGAYSGESLMLAWRDWGVDKRAVNVFDRGRKVDEKPLKVAETGVTIARHFQAQDHEILLVVDSNLVGHEGVMDYLKLTSNGTITTVFYGDYSLGAEPELLSNLDALITFDLDRAKQGLWPAIDPIRSRSRLIDCGLVEREHFSTAAEVRKVLIRETDVNAIVENQSLEALELEDQQIVRKARRLQRFLTQPFSGAEPWTGIPGQNVRLKDAIEGCQAILEGKHDSLPEEAFYFVGPIDQSVEKAKNM